ncbi:MAG: hypothetical protein ACOC3Z_00595 [Nanoarchaeota archaeon]
MLKKIEIITIDCSDLLLSEIKKYGYEEIIKKAIIKKEKIKLIKCQKEDDIFCEYKIKTYLGIPDCYYLTKNGIEFIEIKSQFDGLRINQAEWIKEHKYPVRLIYAYIEHKKEPIKIKKFDFDNILFDEPKGKFKEILNLINNGINYCELCKKVLEKKLLQTEEELKITIKKLMRIGEIYEPKSGYLAKL